jgi:hypothetical protein
MYLAKISPSRSLLVPPAAWGLLLSVWIANVAALGGVAFAAERNLEGKQITFDIPAQPLAQAIEIYGSVTGWEMLYNSNLAIGRRSSAVKGNFTPEAALDGLLTGTGLSARSTGENSVVLLPSREGTSSGAGVGSAVPNAPSSLRWNYYGLIQDSLRVALCEDNDVRPGRYRVAAQFWLGAAGDVVRYHRLGSTGEPRADRRIDETLRNLRIGSPPPAGFAEPVTVLVVPQAPDVTLGCGLDHAGSQPVKSGP